MSLRGFDVLQNIQISRLCDVRGQSFSQPHNYIHTYHFFLSILDSKYAVCESFCIFLDENVEVIYVCLRRLGEDMLQYYRSLLKCDGATDRADTSETSSCTRRFVILTPEAVDYFPVRQSHSHLQHKCKLFCRINYISL